MAFKICRRDLSIDGSLGACALPLTSLEIENRPQGTVGGGGINDEVYLTRYQVSFFSAAGVACDHGTLTPCWGEESVRLGSNSDVLLVVG